MDISYSTASSSWVYDSGTAVTWAVSDGFVDPDMDRYAVLDTSNEIWYGDYTGQHSIASQLCQSRIAIT
jgi:hypothetical protein